MKRSTTLCLAVVIAAVIASPAGAIGVFGQWQDTKDADSGYGLGIKQDFSIAPVFSVETRASWLMFSDDASDDDLNMIPLKAFGRAKLGMFYGGVGVGYYIMTGTESLKNSFGGFGAIGAELGLGGLNAFGEVRYLYLEPEYDGIDGNADMSGIGVSAGINLPF